MRPLRFMLWLLLLGGWQVGVSPQLPYADVQAELLWLLAFHVALHAPAVWVAPVFFAAGLWRDLLFGQHLGANVLLYLLSAVGVLVVRRTMIREHLLTRIGAVSGMVLLVILLRPLFEQSILVGGLSSTAVRGALIRAGWTAALSPLLGALLAEGALCPWREELSPYVAQME